MTNYEKNKELLDMYAVADVSWGVDADGKISECHGNCGYCIFGLDEICTQKRLEWLQQEYKEPEVEVDWSKVPIDTPILVKTGINDEWTERIFAGYIADKVCVFDSYDTSENFVSISPWNYAKLAEQEDEV